MSNSTLLQIVRDSIVEVFEAKRTIKHEEILQNYPILSQSMGCRVDIFLQDKLRNSYTLTTPTSLLENIIICAKKAAFEDPNNPPLTTSEYLHASIKLTLFTPEKTISQKDEPIIKEPYDGQQASIAPKS